MAIYASRTAESLNSDPTPYASRGGHLRTTEDGAYPGTRYFYAPRPSFTPKTTHPANPILVQARNERELGNEHFEWWMNAMLAAFVNPDDQIHRWQEADHIHHARAVLSRLASFRA